MNYDIWPGISLSETPVDWAKVFGSGKLSAKSTANVDRRRKTQGKDFSTFRGISKKSDEMANRGAPGTVRRVIRKLGPAQGRTLQPESKTGKMREALSNGSLTRAELAAAVGVKANSIAAFLKNDLQKGRVLKIVKAGCVHRFALAGAA